MENGVKKDFSLRLTSLATKFIAFAQFDTEQTNKSKIFWEINHAVKKKFPGEIFRGWKVKEK